MGCVIHFFVEYRSKGGKWEADKAHKTMDKYSNSNVQVPNDLDSEGDGYINRDHKMQGFLGDARGNGNNIFPIRGVPSNLSPEVQQAYDYWKGSCFKESYLDFNELKQVIQEYRDSEREDHRYAPKESYYKNEKQIDKRYQKLLDRIEKERKKYNHKCEHGLFDLEGEARVIFWFDH